MSLFSSDQDFEVKYSLNHKNDSVTKNTDDENYEMQMLIHKESEHKRSMS